MTRDIDTNANMPGKTAVVSGAASGIGLAIAALFAKNGMNVVLTDIDREALIEAVRRIAEEGGSAIGVAGDVSIAADCRNVAAEAAETFGGIDILVNNAGIIRRTTVLDIDEEEWDRVMAVNVRSVFLMSKFCIPHMLKAGGGSIVNIGSGWGLKGGGRAVSYCASKGAVVQMTRAMAIDHGPDNIRVNCICPGDIDTQMLRNEAAQLDEDIGSFLADAADRPLKRFGKPEDIAHAALYLAGDTAAYVTGSILVVDGGGLA